MSVILITGAATGIGYLTAKKLASDGHIVWASMRDPEGRNAKTAAEFADLASATGAELHTVDLDVTSQESANEAVRTIVETSGNLDVVVQNAGHLYVGYVEAFTDEDIAHLLDVNAIGAHRVNRAALPYLRDQRSGTLLYVGSTIIVTTPPFLGPYVASKAAFDALAVVTSYEAAQFGIETSIVMPGAITEGTAHFPNASHASDATVTAAYAHLDPLVARNEEATASLVRPGVHAHPQGVADEISRILALPRGQKPFRSVVDFTEAGVDHVMAFSDLTREAFVNRMGFGDTLELKD
ncbi:SDR family NAD(P)-dependent oxidoreductase [Glaciihabitans sp. dw_435]|uniref:SDR family NAD(P)-dependent oxidoreductase n=1 Tax=Glaciihabitans sp. dw_435 TaxID=2720081 RepID=UPI001BD25EA7|nr:SDR family NAD(P)-dependent oxidoreductase [Glaciihabitans sp. dw_435]